MPDAIDSNQTAAELRVVLGRLVRRLRAEYVIPLGQAVVLGRLDRTGPESVSDLAAGERMRPQSMAQTVKELESEGLVLRRADPHDRRRAFVELTDRGRATIRAARRRREDWLATAISRDLSAEEQRILHEAVALLERLAGGA